MVMMIILLICNPGTMHRNVAKRGAAWCNVVQARFLSFLAGESQKSSGEHHRKHQPQEMLRKDVQSGTRSAQSSAESNSRLATNDHIPRAAALSRKRSQQTEVQGSPCQAAASLHLSGTRNSGLSESSSRPKFSCSFRNFFTQQSES